jgi:hypothetical protein
MPAAARLATATALVLALAFALDAQQPDPAKKPPDAPKAAPPPKTPTGVKLPDGTYLWTGDTLPDAVTLSPQELQKLFDQVEQMKKQLATRKTVAPSGCAVRGKVEKRGDTVVVALKLTYSFRTSSPRSAVALGGRRGFLVGASLDGGKLPVLDTGEDGFVALVDSPGDHALALDLEAPVVGRGAKTEVGFDLGLPRAAITTLALELPSEIKTVSLAARTPDPTKTPETRRIPSLDVKRLASAYPLGPVDQVELSWEPPATAAQAAESVRAADFDISAVLTDATIETTARVKPKGATREWRLVTPPNAEVSVERAAGVPAELGPSQPPVVTKPADANRPVWKVELPGSPADWVVVAVVRQPRAKATDAKHRGPFAVGPFAVADVFRQSGTVRAVTAANVRFVAKHGPELRQGEVPGPPEDDRSSIQFKLNTGPTSGTPSFAPLLTLEAHPLQSAVRIKPTYRLRLTDAGWRVRAELRVVPIRQNLDVVTIEVPAEWGTPEASPGEMVNGVDQVKDSPRRALAVKLAAAQKLPFDLVLEATVPVPAGAREFAVPLLRFPGAEEREASLTAVVADGLEVRGSAREWAGEQPLGWGQPLTAVPGADGKTPRAVASVAGKFEGGLSRADLAWQPFRPDLSADVRADVTVHDRQIVVTQQFRLKAADAFAPRVRFKAPAGATGLKATPPLDQVAAGEWSLAAPADAKDATVSVTFALPLPPGEVRKATVGLVQIPAATRTETRVRVWSNATVGRAISADLGAWREVPNEPAVDRDALPALTLLGTGPDLPLVLELRDGVDPAAVAVWVERAAIQVSPTDDGGAALRARFLLKRWLAGAVEVRVPVISPATNPEFQIDGKRVEFATTTEERVYRVPLPEARPGRTAVLEVRYTVPANRPGGASQYLPPVLAATAFAGSVRWLVALPPGAVPLTSDAARVELKWRWRAWLFQPAASSTAEDLDRWFRTGTEPAVGEGVESLLVVQPVPEPLRVRRADRIGFVVGCSLAAFAAGWLASRARGNLAGLLVAALGAAVAAGAVLEPLAASQAAAAVQPGVAALALTLAVQAGFRWYHRSAVTYLPGFTRRPVELEPSSVKPARGGESTGSLVPLGEKPA